MKRRRLFAIACSSIFVLGAFAISDSHDAASVARALPASASGPRARAQKPVLPVVFERNQGQFPRRTQFLARGRDTSFSFESGGIVILPNRAESSAARFSGRLRQLGIEFLNKSEGLRWDGTGFLAGRANYFIGRDSTRWRTDVSMFDSVREREIAPGIDCIARSGADGIELDFVAAPHADLRRLHFRLRGRRKLEIGADGDILARNGAATLRLRSPSIYQDFAGNRVAVAGEYAIGRRGMISFRVPLYDHSHELIIDPSVSLTYTTFLGGSGADSASGVAVDSSGKVYLAGTAEPAGFPETGSTSIGAGAGPDFFVAKIDPTQTGAASLIYLTFIGGSGTEYGGQLAADSSGDVAITGATTSTDYPVTDKSSIGTSANALALSELDAEGNSLLFSTLLAGNGSEATQTPSDVGVAFAPSGNVIVASDTTSTNLPVTTDAYQGTFGSGGNVLNGAAEAGSNDGFFAVYSSSGTLTYLTYLGIDGYPYTDTGGDPNLFEPVQVGVTGVAVDLVGQVYVAGFTSQPGTGFPTTNGFQATYGGGAFDGFLMCFSPNGHGTADLIYSTFLGGSNFDQALGVAVDGAIPANAYVAGTTQSTNIVSSPAISGYQTALNGTANGFLAVVSQSSAGVTSLNYATFFGGSGSDSALGVIALGENAVYIAGHTASPNFPTFQTLQSFSGTSDAFVAKFDTTQSGVASLLYSTLLGGSVDAQANGVAATANGNVFVGGNTTSSDFPHAGNPQTGFQPTCASCLESPPLPDAFLVALAENSNVGPIVEFNPSELNFQNVPVGTPAQPLFSTLTNSGIAPLEISSLEIVGQNAGDFSESNIGCPVSQTLGAGANCSITITFSPSTAGVETAALSLTDNAPGSPQTVNLLGTGQEPVASPSPQTVSFGNQPEGTTSAQQVVTLSNTGNLALDISYIGFSGPDYTQFNFLQNYSCAGVTIVQPAASCSIGIVFKPQTTGNFNATLQIMDNAGNVTDATQSIPLSGTGVPPSAAVNLAPTSLIFTSQIVGTTSGPQSVTLTNTGSLALQISTISLAGTNTSAFSIGSNCPGSSGRLAAGAQCTASVTFTPSSLGPQTASISFSDNISGSPQLVSLSGTGVSASLSVLPAGIAFSPQTLQIPAANQSATISNNGTVPVQISSVTVGGADAADFPATPNCPGTLYPPGESKNNFSCQVSVQFQPSAGGPRSANISIVDNASGSPQIVTLSGMGLVPSVALPGTIPAFNAQLVGTTSAASPIAITNTGTGALSISSLTLSGTNSGDFQQMSTCVDNAQHTNMIPAGATCTVNMTFVPQAAGNRSATFNIADNALNSPQMMALSGAAVDYSVGVTPGDPQSVVVTAGQTANYNLQVLPLGGFTGAVNLACTGAPAVATCSISQPSVNIAGTSPVGFMVSVATTAASTSWIGTKFRGTPSGISQNSGRTIFLFPLFALALMAILVMIAGAFCARRSSRISALVAIPALCVVVLLILAGCGGGNGGGAQTTSTVGTPAGIYTLIVTGSVQGVSRTVQLTLDVQ
jgi:hypothetical protein